MPHARPVRCLGGRIIMDREAHDVFPSRAPLNPQQFGGSQRGGLVKGGSAIRHAFNLHIENGTQCFTIAQGKHIDC